MSDPDRPVFRRRRSRSSSTTSLKQAPNVSYVDLYQCHRYDVNTPLKRRRWRR